jgi:hypothetical protein
MSRNLGRTACAFCYGEVALDEAPRPITREEAGCYYDTRDGYGYAGGIFANATCSTCGAKYLAWCDLSGCAGYGRWGEKGTPFFDLSHRAAFNDEPAEEDLPDWKIEEATLTVDQCAALSAISGTIKRRSLWPRCERTGKKIFSVYGCRCEQHYGEEANR